MKEKLKKGIHIISQGEKFRECVRIYTEDKDKYSITFHQVKIAGKWCNKRLK
jgi:hypothetical protein